MVSLVIVSHSRALAFAAVELAKQVSAAPSLPIAAAGGAGPDHHELGTDAMDIMEAIRSVHSEEGTVILMDLGSAVLSTKMALEMLEPEISAKCIMCSAPLIEGAVSAAVQLNAGATAIQICQDARASLMPKEMDLGDRLEENRAATQHGESYKNYIFTSHLKDGLHARPASSVVKALAGLDAVVTLYNITRARGPQPANSINRLAMLGILIGDSVEVRASGPDAETALKAVEKLVDENFGEVFVAVEKEEDTDEDGLLVLSPGVAAGRLYIEGIMANIEPVPIADAEAEIAAFEKAIAEVKKSLIANKADMLSKGHGSEGKIFEAHILILEDREVIEEVKKEIRDKMNSAAYLYMQKMQMIAGEFRLLPGNYMPQRAADVIDVASQVVRQLNGDKADDIEYNEDIILYAKEITPSMLAKHSKGRLKGMLTERGGASSHVAILAKTLEIPTIAGYIKPDAVKQGAMVMLDTDRLEVTVNPSGEKLKELYDSLKSWEEQKKQDYSDSLKEPVTMDGTYINVRGNVGDEMTAKLAVDNGAIGVGLLRTEFLFMSAQTPPGEEKQTAMLREIFQHFPDSPVTVRTLDIGGDKPLAWLKQPKEENPFLGVRGVRLCQKETELFMTHVRAILRAGDGYSIKVMIPMIDTVDELEFCRDVFEKAHDALVKEKLPHKWPVPLGIMIETPASVMMADELAVKSDFFSIGSNDLSQYCMAAERGNKVLYELSNSYQPAVLRMIKLVADSAVRHNIEISVCGEMAGDPMAAKIIIGMGIYELSMSASSIGRVKRAIISSDIKENKKFADNVIKQATLAAVRSLL